MSAELMQQLNHHIWAKRKPVELVENRVSFAGPDSELSLYDTFDQASKVRLKADSLLYCGMVQGRKVMHTRTRNDIEFLPHESFILAPNEEVLIDFPEATQLAPTSCLTVEISEERIAKLCDRMNDILSPRFPTGDPLIDPSRPLHTHHTQATQQLIEKLVSHYVQQDPDRDLLVDFCISELATRMLRHHGREAIRAFCQRMPDANGLSAALHWIEHHLNSTLDVDQLCKLACMSRSRFYQEFKRLLGCTPMEYQHQRRMQQARHLLQKGLSVTQVSFEVGYQSLSHFSRRFHQHFGMPPGQIRRLQ